MHVSIRERFGQIPFVTNVSWESFCDWISAGARQQYASKTDCPALIFANTHGGFLEEQIDPAGLEALALDFDNVPMWQLSQFIEHAKLFDEHVLIHTTFSHAVDPGPETARFRVITPLDSPVPKWAWSAVQAEGARHFINVGFQPDPVCANFARCWFVPAVNINAPDWAQPWIWYK